MSQLNPIKDKEEGLTMRRLIAKQLNIDSDELTDGRLTQHGQRRITAPPVLESQPTNLDEMKLRIQALTSKGKQALPQM